MKPKNQPKLADAPRDVFNDIQNLNRDLMNDEVGFKRLSIHLAKLTGVHLTNTPKNHALMANRLRSILTNQNLTTYSEYFEVLKGENPKVVNEFISSLTTHTTHFFRENPQLEVFKKILVEYFKKHDNRAPPELRIWCAACSTGQEPYTLAMIVRECMGIPDYSKWQIKILATDIDLASLHHAANGVYTKTEAISLPSAYQKYLKEKPSSSGEFYEIDPRLQSMIRFAPLNLLDKRYPFRQKFDFIFCRNVLIYFEEVLAFAITQRFEDALALGGYLIVGASESGYIKRDRLTQLVPSVYLKKSEE